MIRNIPFVHSPNGPVVPTITKVAALTEKVSALVVVLTEADLTDNQTSVVKAQLTNATFVEEIKKAP